jgi:hypothetical protein
MGVAIHRTTNLASEAMLGYSMARHFPLEQENLIFARSIDGFASERAFRQN